jgi:hypothetical protein
MSILRVRDGLPDWVAAVFRLGQSLTKQAAEDEEDGGTPELSSDLAGQLYLSAGDWLLLSVPNALVHGIFSALGAPGVELPPGRDGGRMNAHIVVMHPEEVARAGGADQITERGKQFHYSLGRLYESAPDEDWHWPGMARIWSVRVHSPELQALRRSYGLPSLPDSTHGFHVVVACRRRGVLGRNDTKKGADAVAPLRVVKRARSEEEPFTLAVDLDSVLLDGGPEEEDEEEGKGGAGLGRPRERALEWARRLHDAGARLVVCTSRADEEQVRDWLKKHKVPADDVRVGRDACCLPVPAGRPGEDGVAADAYWGDGWLAGGPAQVSVTVVQEDTCVMLSPEDVLGAMEMEDDGDEEGDEEDEEGEEDG